MAKTNWVNKTHIEGRIFSHTLQKRETGPQSKAPGTIYIGGTINVATDDAGLNVVPVRFTYITEKTKAGSPRESFQILEKIIADNLTWEAVGAEKAQKVRIDGDVEVNDFLSRTTGEMVEAKGVRGSFIHFVNGVPGLSEDDNKRNTFETDMLIAATTLQEPEDDEPYMNLRGYVFGYRNALIPVTYSIKNPEGIKYFEDQDISNDNPLLTKVWGNIISTTTTVKKEVESAFGGAKVETTSRTLRAWNVVGCAVEPYEWNSEETITIDEFKTLLDERAQVVAAAKKRSEEYQNSGAGKAGFPSSGSEKPSAASGSESNSMAGFKF